MDPLEIYRRHLKEARVKRVFNAVTGRREALTRRGGHTHKHTATFKRCLKHLAGKGHGPGGQHRICYSAGAGGEGSSGAAKRKAKKKRR